MDARFAVALESVSTDHYAFATCACSRTRALRLSPSGVHRAEAGFTVSGKLKVIKVLFVCMGNICRSPTAEGVFRHVLRQQNLEDRVEVDSAGTHGYHAGEAPDQRTQRAAAVRGYDLSEMRARKVASQDLDYFDQILAMDRNNLEVLKRICPPEKHDRLGLLMSYSKSFDDDEVPDPYYGLGHGFDLVLDMIEDAAQGLVESIEQQLLAGPMAPPGPTGPAEDAGG